MDEQTILFVEAMVPILEQESGMVWGPQGVGRIVRWTCSKSNSQIVSDAFLEQVRQIEAIVREALWSHGKHHKQWYLERVALTLGLDLGQLDHEMARAGNVDREPGIAPQGFDKQNTGR